jgi:hypothetical protein
MEGRMPDYAAQYAQTEQQLKELLRAIIHTLNGAELGEVSEFLTAREYGLALETIARLLMDRHGLILPDIVKRVDRLAGSMHLTDADFVREFHIHAGR